MSRVLLPKSLLDEVPELFFRTFRHSNHSLSLSSRCQDSRNGGASVSMIAYAGILYMYS